MMLRNLLSLSFAVTLVACGGGSDVPKLVIATTTLPDVHVGEMYTGKIEVSGGQKPYMFSVATGAIPDGLDLNPVSGALSGVAARAGHHMFTVAVTDAAKQTASVPLTLFVVPDPLMIVTTALPSGKEGSPYNQALVAKGGIEPLRWSLAQGSLPMGVDVIPDGHVMGTPSEFGSFDFTVRVTDSDSTARDQALHLTLSSLNPMITTSSIAKAHLGDPYSATLAAQGGQPPYSWTIASGALPMGVDLATTGELAGVPTQSGTFPITVRVSDALGHLDMGDLELRVIAPLAIDTAVLPQAITARPYTFRIQSSGGEPPYTWSIGSGTLPTGIRLDPNGLLHGTSTMLGESMITVRVRDNEGFQKSALFSFIVSDRYTYTVTPMTPIPTTCSSTSVSYTAVPIDVPESYQVADVNVSVDIDYHWNPNNTRNHNVHDRAIGAPRLVLFGPDGSQSVLCGNGVDVPGGPECQASDLSRDYDDDAGQAAQPERPLTVFDGLNARGQWRLLVVIAEPSCSLTGTVNSVTLSIQDDRSPDTYVFVRGYRKNNLITSPWVRICSPSCGGVDDHELQLSAIAYDVGPNGYPEGGAGDDVPNPVPMTWAWQGSPIAGVGLTPDGHVTVFDSGVRTCNDTTCYGTAQRGIVASGGGNVVMLQLRVVPPAWNQKTREY